jgi:hypothetical protein
MNPQEMEVVIKELQSQVKTLQTQLGITQDIEAIKKLQRTYGYYIDNWLTNEIVDLFSDSPDTLLIVHSGKFHGKEGVKRFFRAREGREKRRPNMLHQVMQLSPIIDVSPDGMTAWGRWYGFGANATPVPDGIYHGWMDGVYENEYIKENGVWRIKILRWWMYFFAPYSVGWIEKEKQCDPHFRHKPPLDTKPDEPGEETLYPSTYICPFHYNHPTTGQPVKVAEENKI